MSVYEVVYRWGLMHQATTEVRAATEAEARALVASRYGAVLSIRVRGV